MPGKRFRLSVYRAGMFHSARLATMFECVPQITVEPVITVREQKERINKERRKERTRILIGAQLKFIGLHTRYNLSYRTFRTRVYINSACRAVTSIATSSYAREFKLLASPYRARK